MKLENIDTSTIEGKIEVMRLASEGRNVALKAHEVGNWHFDVNPIWNWVSCDYAIIAEPVGPEEVWVRIEDGGPVGVWNNPSSPMPNDGSYIVRYIRADD